LTGGLTPVNNAFDATAENMDSVENVEEVELEADNTEVP
jgi:hypothetical protein